jgi:hypothetical protein
MDPYRIALFFHLAALLGAISTAAILHQAQWRLLTADSPAALRPAAMLLKRLKPVFPLALLVLVATGAYMTHKSWSWSDGWVESSLVAVGVLLINGAVVVGSRGRRVGRALATGDPAALALTRDPVLHIAPWLNTGLAIGVVFVMATKLSLAGSVAALVIAALIGAAVGAAGVTAGRGQRSRRSHSEQRSQ